MTETTTPALVAVAELVAELAHADRLVAEQAVVIEALEAEVARLRATLGARAHERPPVPDGPRSPRRSRCRAV